MQDRVFDAADILVDRQPGVGGGRVGRRFRVPRVGEAREVPGRIHERVHRVRLAPRGGAALRAGRVLPGGMTVERIARRVEGHVVGQPHRQIRLRHRHDAAGLAMDDRDRTAPVALARNAPVAQLVIDLAAALRPVAERRGLQPTRDFLARGGDRQAVEEAGIDHDAVAVIGDLVDREACGIDVRRADHRRRAEAADIDEIEVALIVRRAAKDRARAVVHQDEVGDIDRQAPVGIEGMHDPHAGVVALLLRRLDGGDGGADPAAFLDEGGEFGVMRGRCGGERMVGRDRHELGAEQRVGARGVDFQFAVAFDLAQRGGIDGEAHQQAFRAADPVALHQPNLVRPAVEAVEALQQVLGIVGNAQEPLGQLALLHDGAGAPAAPVHHLLVGEHGMVDRVPVHLGFLARHQSGGEEIEEQALLMLVIAGIAGGDLARPVEREAHRLQLTAHRVDIGVGPLGRMRLVLHRRVFRRHAEGVPAHRVQNVEAARPLVAGHDVAHRVVADMAHVDAPGGIGEHLKNIVFGPAVHPLGREDILVRPDLLPPGLGLTDVIALGPHDNGSHLLRKSGNWARQNMIWPEGSNPPSRKGRPDCFCFAPRSFKAVGLPLRPPQAAKPVFFHELSSSRARIASHPGAEPAPDPDDGRHARGRIETSRLARAQAQRP